MRAPCYLSLPLTVTYRVAINGYGRIGQSVLRALYEGGYRRDLEIVAINELSDLATISYLTRYDTTHGRFPGRVAYERDTLFVNQDAIHVTRAADPSELQWRDLDIDLVLECSGSFTRRDIAEQYLAAGARRLLFSQPAEPTVDATIVYGINEQELRPEHRVVSAASCTTNCSVPVLKLLDEAFGIEQGLLTTIHSAMNDQPVIDAYNHTSLRLTRAALSSIIPVPTGLGRGIDRLLPHLAGRFKANSVRVPTLNVSAVDMTLSFRKPVSREAINALLSEAARTAPLEGLLGFTEEPHASVDFNHDSRSVIVDGTQTQVVDQHMAKLLCWFDNEWGFANRMLDVARAWLKGQPERHA